MAGLTGHRFPIINWFSVLNMTDETGLGKMGTDQREAGLFMMGYTE
jgi:hypothetical protein